MTFSLTVETSDERSCATLDLLFERHAGDFGCAPEWIDCTDPDARIVHSTFAVAGMDEIQSLTSELLAAGIDFSVARVPAHLSQF